MKMWRACQWVAYWCALMAVLSIPLFFYRLSEEEYLLALWDVVLGVFNWGLYKLNIRHAKKLYAQQEGEKR